MIRESIRVGSRVRCTAPYRPDFVGEVVEIRPSPILNPKNDRWAGPFVVVLPDGNRPWCTFTAPACDFEVVEGATS